MTEMSIKDFSSLYVKFIVNYFRIREGEGQKIVFKKSYIYIRLSVNISRTFGPILTTLGTTHSKTKGVLSYEN